MQNYRNNCFQPSKKVAGEKIVKKRLCIEGRCKSLNKTIIHKPDWIIVEGIGNGALPVRQRKKDDNFLCG